MASLNKVQLIGYIGDAPEVRYMPNGDAVAVFSLATNEHWKTKEGDEKERTDWHRVVMYRGLAEIAKEHFAKGTHLYIEGKLRNRSWEDKEGIKRYTTEIIADEFKFLDKKDPAAEKIKSGSAKPTPTPAAKGDFNFDDDVPF
jgi:single-strand DNA-binding protein